MRDLEIRGAGNLLGTGQSGHIAAVGYDLYCQMVTEAVAELKGEALRTGRDQARAPARRTPAHVKLTCGEVNLEIRRGEFGFRGVDLRPWGELIANPRGVESKSRRGDLKLER